MLNANRHRRFPRAKYLRQLERVTDELRNWHDHYELRAEVAETPAMRELAEDRAKSLDKAWHVLNTAYVEVSLISWH